MRTALEDIQKQPNSVIWEDVFFDIDQESGEKWSQELFSLLVSLVSGEALMIIKGVPGGTGGRPGGSWPRGLIRELRRER